MIILKGAEVSAKIKEQTAEMLKQCGGRIPKLAIVRVGENPDDLSYERGAVKKMAAFGLSAEVYAYPADIGDEAFKAEFQKINGDPEVDGILLLRPLPKQIHEREIERMIDPEKDLDGISPENIAKVFAGDSSGYAPCTAEAVVETLKAFEIRKAGGDRGPQHGRRETAVHASVERKCHGYHLPHTDRESKRDLPERRDSGGGSGPGEDA